MDKADKAMYQDTSVSTFNNSAGAYRHLGDRTFWYMAAQNMGTGAAFLFLAVFTRMVRGMEFIPAESLALVDLIFWITFLLAGLSLIVGYTITKLIHSHLGFKLGPDALKIKRGVLFKEEFAMPYRNIQNIEIERTVFQRLIGVSTVIILTSGFEHKRTSRGKPENVIPLIDKELAIDLRNSLLRRVNVQKTIDHSVAHQYHA